jgi:hypothetical protein
MNQRGWGRTLTGLCRLDLADGSGSGVAVNTARHATVEIADCRWAAKAREHVVPSRASLIESRDEKMIYSVRDRRRTFRSLSRLLHGVEQAAVLGSEGT